jgi:hypothetical protein
MLEGVQKVGAILIALEDSFLFVAAGGNVIDSAGVFYTEGTGHTKRISEAKDKVKHYRPDPRNLPTIARGVTVTFVLAAVLQRGQYSLGIPILLKTDQTLQSVIFRFFICLNSFVLLVTRVTPRA